MIYRPQDNKVKCLSKIVECVRTLQLSSCSTASGVEVSDRALRETEANSHHHLKLWSRITGEYWRILVVNGISREGDWSSSTYSSSPWCLSLILSCSSL